MDFNYFLMKICVINNYFILYLCDTWEIVVWLIKGLMIDNIYSFLDNYIHNNSDSKMNWYILIYNYEINDVLRFIMLIVFYMKILFYNMTSASLLLSFQLRKQ